MTSIVLLPKLFISIGLDWTIHLYQLKLPNWQEDFDAEIEIAHTEEVKVPEVAQTLFINTNHLGHTHCLDSNDKWLVTARANVVFIYRWEILLVSSPESENCISNS